MENLPANNPFNPPAVQQLNAVANIEGQRAVQEAQAAMIIAKRFPRDQFAAYERIMQACRRVNLAQHALYAYPRGGQLVTGPSIRLAEAIAQAWGNIKFGIRELSQSDGASEVEAFCWDMEANTSQIKVFKVPHKRHTKKGSYDLTDPRDIYEIVANQGARRLRSCILGVIPGDIIDDAIKVCEATMNGSTGKPIADVAREWVVAFKDLGVTQDMLEQRLGHKMDSCIVQEFTTLSGIYRSIVDGMAKREDYFDISGAKDKESGDRLKEAVSKPDEPKHGEKFSDPKKQKANEAGKPLIERVSDMLDAFGEIGVTDGMVLDFAGVQRPEDITESHLKELRKKYAAVKKAQEAQAAPNACKKCGMESDLPMDQLEGAGWKNGLCPDCL